MEERGTAVWWTPTMPSPTTPKPHLVDNIDDANKSAASTSQLRLEGEMHLDGDLLPTFEVPFLSVSVRFSFLAHPSISFDHQQ